MFWISILLQWGQRNNHYMLKAMSPSANDSILADQIHDAAKLHAESAAFRMADVVLPGMRMVVPEVQEPLLEEMRELS